MRLLWLRVRQAGVMLLTAALIGQAPLASAFSGPCLGGPMPCCPELLSGQQSPNASACCTGAPQATGCALQCASARSLVGPRILAREPRALQGVQSIAPGSPPIRVAAYWKPPPQGPPTRKAAARGGRDTYLITRRLRI